MLIKRSFEGIMARVVAGLTHGLHGHLEWVAAQILPDKAEIQFVIRWARMFGMSFLLPTKALGVVNFPSAGNVPLPIGHRMKRADGVEFEVDTAIGLGGFSIAGVIAVETGRAGNTDALDTLTLVSPVAGVDDDGVVQAPGITGGTDLETGEELRTRVLERMESPDRAGAIGDYVAWAREVPGVLRAWEYANRTTLGTVDLLFVEGEPGDDTYLFPSAPKIADVQAHLDLVRPITTDVTVSAPTAQGLDMTIGVTPNTAEVRAAVEAEINSMFYRDSEPGGTILLSRIREAVSAAPGETDHSVTVPAGDTTATSADHILVPGNITWV